MGVTFQSETMDTVAHTLTVSVSFSDLVAGTTAAHIHCCTAPPTNSSVATMTPDFTGFPLGVTAGSFSNTYDTTLDSTFNATFVTNNGGTTVGAEAALFSCLLAGQAYLNSHPSLFPGGEIRGFPAGAPLPEPATIAPTGFSLAGVALLRRRES